MAWYGPTGFRCGKFVKIAATFDGRVSSVSGSFLVVQILRGVKRRAVVDGVDKLFRADPVSPAVSVRTADIHGAIIDIFGVKI